MSGEYYACLQSSAMGRNLCVYVYSENSLLRRVVVFRSKSKIYEVELRQNSESLALSSVVDAQMAFVKSLMRRNNMVKAAKKSLGLG